MIVAAHGFSAPATIRNMSERIITNNGAVFVNHSRMHRDVIVKVDGSTLTVAHVRRPDLIIETMTLAQEVTDETSSAPDKHVDAWDGYTSRHGDKLVRIAVASGCGCSGCHFYSIADGKTTTIDNFGKPLV